MEAAEMAGADGAAVKKRRKLQFNAGRKCERAFRADQEMRQIDVVAPGNDGVEIVTADAALHLWNAPLDFSGFAAGNRKKIAKKRGRHINAAFARAAEMRSRAVGEHSVDRDNVFARVAIAQRARAAGIVADHPADRGA